MTPHENSMLDDISAVIGFTATLRLSAWYGDRGNLYIPSNAEEGHPLAKLLGVSVAKRLSKEWGGTHISVPRLTGYEEDGQKRFIGEMLARGCSPREISHLARVGERRVQQICRELETAGLIPVIAPRKMPPKNPPEKTPGKSPLENGGSGGVDESNCEGD